MASRARSSPPPSHTSGTGIWTRKTLQPSRLACARAGGSAGTITCPGSGRSQRKRSSSNRKTKPMKQFEHLILIAADDVSELRRCDVFRVVEASYTVRGVEPGRLAEWLIEERPDLTQEVAECQAECQ